MSFDLIQFIGYTRSFKNPLKYTDYDSQYKGSSHAHVTFTPNPLTRITIATHKQTNLT